MMDCPSCGRSVADDAVFCPQCGARLADSEQEQSLRREEAGSGQPESQAAGGPDRPQRSAASGLGDRLSPPRRDDDEDEEQLLWEGGYCGRAMFGSWVLAAAVTVAAILLAAMIGQIAHKWTLAFVIALVAWLVPLARLTYRKMSIHYRLTTQRLFHEEGILRRTTDRVELIDCDDVTVDRTIFDRLMNVGTVRVESSDRTHPNLFLNGIDNALEVAERIDAARRRERLRRGIHIEAV